MNGRYWPNFRWDEKALAERLVSVRHRQGRLVGRIEALGFPLRSEAMLQTLTEDVTNSSAIEGEILDRGQVRSSIARRLGLDIGGLTPADRRVEGVVEMMLDATQKYDQPLTAERLFGWHAAITHDPLPLKWNGEKIEGILAAEKESRQIAVIIADFVGPSELHDLYSATGRAIICQHAMEESEIKGELFLAIRETIYHRIFKRSVGLLALEKRRFGLIVFDPATQEIVKWKT
jgi:hypothetical protein